MFDLGFAELLVIGVVALIVIGPKDLPGMFRSVGKFTARARSMAREFSSAMNAAADDAGVGDISRDLKNVTSAKNLGLDAVKDVASDIAKWSPEDAISPKTVGPETAKLRQQRAEQVRKIREETAKRGQEKLDREAKKAAEAGDTAEPVSDEVPQEAAAKLAKAKKPKAPAKKQTTKKATTPAKTAAKKKSAPAKKNASKKTGDA